MTVHTPTGLTSNGSGVTSMGNWRNPVNRNINGQRYPISPAQPPGHATSYACTNILYIAHGAIDNSTQAKRISIFSSIARSFSTNVTYYNYALTGILARTRAWLTGRRPASGLQYPRGYYNK